MRINKIYKLFILGTLIFVTGCNTKDITNTSQVKQEIISQEVQTETVSYEDLIEEVVLPNEGEILEKVKVLQQIDSNEEYKVTMFKQIYDDYGVEQAAIYYDKVKDTVLEQDKYKMLTYRTFHDEYNKSNLLDMDSLKEQVEQELSQQNNLLISDVSIKQNELTLTVKNNSGQTIDYFKYDIFYYNQNNEIVDSEWSNCSDTILPDAQCITYTYINPPNGWDTAQVVIQEINFK